MVTAGEGAAAEALVRDRSVANDPGLFDWLLARARVAGDLAAVARWSEALLLAAPTIERWRAAKRAVEGLGAGAWDEARPRLLQALERSAHRVAVEALLDEGDLARALVLVAPEPTVDASGAAVPAGMKLRVAEAAEKTHPREAMSLWKGHVRDLIATGRRTRYREAAVAAQRVCALGCGGGSLSLWCGGRGWGGVFLFLGLFLFSLWSWSLVILGELPAGSGWGIASLERGSAVAYRTFIRWPESSTLILPTIPASNELGFLVPSLHLSDYFLCPRKASIPSPSIPRLPALALFPEGRSLFVHFVPIKKGFHSANRVGRHLHPID
jgi:hypothetical protein